MSRRPPAIALGYIIARGGEKIIPEFMEALRNEKDEWMQNARYKTRILDKISTTRRSRSIAASN
jgi:hypothetical protein